MTFGYSNLPVRPAGRFLAVTSRLLPGVARVQAQVGPFARAWREANLRALSGDGPLWVALGDSLSQGIGASRYDRGWVGLLHARLAAEGRAFRLVNLSVSGARTLDVLERQLPELPGLGEPALVTLLIGSNDLFRREGREQVPADHARLLAAVPAGTVVATLPNPTRLAGTINAGIEKAARARGLVVADTRRPETTRWRGKLAGDRFHPNDRGYAAIAGVFAEAVARVP